MERWLPILGWERTYEVSNRGRIRRMRSGHGTFVGKIMALTQGRNGYLRVHLSNRSKRKSVLVAGAVAEAFLGARKHGMQVNHKDGNKRNNRVANLEWVTARDNLLHAHSTGLVSRSGEKNGRAKLTNANVREIRASHERTGTIAHRLGVDRKTVLSVRQGRSWTHVE